MARLLVLGATLRNERIETLRVQLVGLPRRTLDRPTAIAWMRDHHSFIPVRAGRELSALQLVEVAEQDGEMMFSIRHDNEPRAADALPQLPDVHA
jgi:hypothetical protein